MIYVFLLFIHTNNAIQQKFKKKRLFRTFGLNLLSHFLRVFASWASDITLPAFFNLHILSNVLPDCLVGVQAEIQGPEYPPLFEQFVSVCGLLGPPLGFIKKSIVHLLCLLHA